jgi:CheY-like chemotaxis protein
MAEWTPDLVFLDLELHPPDGSAPPGPGGKGDPSASQFLNGDALGRELVRRNPALQVVIVTALDSEHPRVQALRKGVASDVIVKPVRAARVQEVLAHLGYFSPP